ncbi:MAG: UDP-N-acetylmuramoyl-L-alanine--D-glutamate ligase [Deltaproteobacteria bacterium]|nr:UDP-N-acetylmuramoyl-L-alanine--D-glutamate ligase [Candidatus Anaeroferrophillacea bacterium]
MPDNVSTTALHYHLPPLAGARVLVAGLGGSGVAALRFLAGRGARVAATDIRPAAELEGVRAALADISLERLETGGHSLELARGQDFVVVSPGVPLDREPWLSVRVAGIPLIAEVELAARNITQPVIGVTGTNGKTTTVTLMGELFAAAGWRAFVGGNIGRPAVEMAVGAGEWELGIWELSSFQLETIDTFRPRIGVILSVTPDHQDRYAVAGDYLTAKLRLARNQVRGDFLLLDIDDDLLAREYESRLTVWKAGGCGPRPVPFSGRAVPVDGIGGVGSELRWDLPGPGVERLTGSFSIAGMRLIGAHNRGNVAAAFGAGLLVGLDPEIMAATINDFAPLPHRLETVGEVNGITFVNDSKATNVDAVVKAVNSFDRPLVLLLGGYDKGGDFTLLDECMGGRVRDVVLFGRAAETIARQLPHYHSGSMAPGLESAVRLATERARPGDVVLLSPGCASFDEFSSYRARGDFFKQVVGGLAVGGAP